MEKALHFRDGVGAVVEDRRCEHGIGLSEAVRYDLDGRVGRATASILIEPR